ncbi:glycosyltransferase family 87 protein [Kocuria sp. KH4]
MRTALVGAWVLAVLVLGKIVQSVVIEPRVYGQDSHAYWLAAQGDLAYSRAAGTVDAYLYSPAFLWLLKPLSWLPWPVFLVSWTVLLLLTAVWLVRPLRWQWAVPLFIYCLPEILVSNIFLLLAVAAVLGVRWPGLWAFPILTKVTMGVGLLWFAGRRQWRDFFTGAVAALSIAAIGYVLQPQAWDAWFDFLVSNRDGTRDGLGLFIFRCSIAIALVLLAARLDKAWLIAPAMLLASPVLVSIVPAALLVAIPRLAMTGRRHRDVGAAPTDRWDSASQSHADDSQWV